MTTFRPSEIHQLAIQAKLNFALGAHVYDDVFAGFEVLEIAGEELRGWATSKYGRQRSTSIFRPSWRGSRGPSRGGRCGAPASCCAASSVEQTDEQPAWADDGDTSLAFLATNATSKRRALLARQKGVRSVRKKLLR